MSAHPWKRAWGEDPVAAREAVLLAQAKGAKRAVEQDRKLKATVEARRCVICKQPLASFRRLVCPPCKASAGRP